MGPRKSIWEVFVGWTPVMPTPVFVKDNFAGRMDVDSWGKQGRGQKVEIS